MKNLSISAKISLGFSMVILLFLTVTFFIVNNAIELDNDARRVERAFNIVDKVELILGDLKDAETGQRGYLITGVEAYMEPYTNAETQLAINLKLLSEELSSFPSQMERFNKLTILIKQKFDELKETIDLRKNEGFESARTVVLTDKGKLVMDEIRVILDAMIRVEENLLDQEMATIEENIVTSTIVSLALLIVSIIVVIVLIIYYSRVIARPLKELSIVAKEISVGNLNKKVHISDARDEIGELSGAFRIMQENLKIKAENAKSIADGNLRVEMKLISENDTLGEALNIMVTNLNDQMTEVNSGVNVLSSSSSEIMALMSQLSSSSIETATSISQTTATVEELKQSAHVSTRRASEISESSQESIKVSQRGNKSIEDTIVSMNKIKNQMESIADNVIRLSDQSQSIGDIINSVTDIAEQSNLLAVNASIEAAKAGEQGKGFAVVAQEIRNLSERSKESTENIRNILNDIQKSIGHTVMATEQGGKSVDEGLELSSIAREVIETLAVNVEQAAQAIFQITASNQEQFVGLEQINVAMENINISSNQSVSSIKETEDSISSLNQLGVQLQGILTQYKL